jgi:signal transduction histidine kinase/ActR/RegA family two-component response regulator
MTEDAGVATARQSVGHPEPQSWRERVLQGLLWSTTAVFASIGAWTAFAGYLGAEGRWVFGVGGALMLMATLAGSRLSYSFRTAALLGISSMAALFVLARNGYAPNAFIAFGFVTIAATLLLGARGGVGAVLLFSAGLAVFPALHRAGIVTRAAEWARLLDSSVPENVARIVVNFLVMSSSSVLAVSYLLRRGERLLSERTRSLEQLAREQAEKERIRADMALREAAYRKAAELEILGRLSGSMAHDFNNALLVIFAAVDQLSRADVPPQLEPAVEAIRLAATQAASATRQLRAFGPHSSHAVTNLSLSPAVRRLAALLERVLPSNITVELDVEDEVVIRADEGQVQRMLTNLVLNARDAMRDGGRVILRVKRDAMDSGVFALLEVEDNGGGMSEEVVQRLFEPFFTTKGGAGTGLGLASVRQLVEGAGGRIRVRSRLGEGTTCSVHWPLSQAAVGAAPLAHAVAGAVPLAQAASVSGTGINVLVVDDDTAVRSLLVRGLRRFGFSVLEAGDGKEGLLMARRHREPIDALCADCIMPGIPLRELVAGFRESHPRASVVVCSGHAAEEVGFDADTADRFLGKPFQVKELASCICDLRKRDRDPAECVMHASANVA